MKKIAFLILVASILSACLSTPSQLTVTPEASPTLPPTNTPAPTLHPDFIALQELIAASSGRFSLRADGYIYDGETPIPDVTVAPDGTMTMTVDSKNITLNSTEVNFDDEKGISIKGYELDEETGAWVETESEAMQTVTALVEQYGLDLESVTIAEEGGEVSVIDNETKVVIMRSSEFGIQHDLEFAVDAVAKNSCESKSEFKPDQSGRIATSNRDFRDYLSEIRYEFGYSFNGLKTFNILLDREKQCWGTTDGKYLFYRTEDGTAIKLTLIPTEEDKILEFLFSR